MNNLLKIKVLLIQKCSKLKDTNYQNIPEKKKTRQSK